MRTNGVLCFIVSDGECSRATSLCPGVFDHWLLRAMIHGHERKAVALDGLMLPQFRCPEEGGDVQKTPERDGLADSFVQAAENDLPDLFPQRGWQRFADVTKPGEKQFPGWPVTVKP